MKRPLSLPLAATLPGMAAAQSTLDLSPEVLDGFHVTVDEVRANSGRVYDALTGSEGGPIPRARFVALELPSELMPEQPDPQVLEKLFAVLDSDGDGHLARAEWTASIERDLAFADENEDGRITLKKLANVRENLELGEALDVFF